MELKIWLGSMLLGSVIYAVFLRGGVWLRNKICARKNPDRVVPEPGLHIAILVYMLCGFVGSFVGLLINAYWMGETLVGVAGLVSFAFQVPVLSLILRIRFVWAMQVVLCEIPIILLVVASWTAIAWILMV